VSESDTRDADKIVGVSFMIIVTERLAVRMARQSKMRRSLAVLEEAKKFVIGWKKR
jgi:hypothetical protein